MTEAQFEKTLELWKECEKHGLTTAQMYHISEILRSYVNPDPIIDDYLTAVMKGDLPYTNGIPKKITLCSDGICYGPCPEPDEERIQKVTVSATGKVYITLKNYEGKTLRKMKKSVPTDKAAVWLNNVNTHLSVLNESMWVTDVGLWNIEIFNEHGNKYRSSGCLVEGDKWLDKYSDELREMLDMPELYVFNETVYSEIRICSCEFEYGGKQYYYQTTDKSIHIGDTVLVPVGNSGDQRKVQVTDIENLDEVDLPMELDKIKTIICKVELDPPYTDLADIQKLNTEILGEVLNTEPSVFGIVKTAIDGIDCVGLLELGAPHDEYNGESRLIASKLKPEYDIYQIASTIAEVMTNSFDKPFGIDSFIGISGQIKKQYDILNKLKGDSVHVVDMRECFDIFADKQVEITLKDGKVFVGILEDWISALDNEPDPESIIIKTPEQMLVELFVREIRYISLKSEMKSNKIKSILSLDTNSKISPDEVSELIKKIETERDIAQLFAYAENIAWYIEDDEYDYEEGTDEWNSARDEADRWFAISDQLRERIFSILRSENVVIPNKGWISVLEPFMERNGFRNASGWWQSKSEEG